MPNGRAACPTSGLTPRQYAEIQRAPAQYVSEKEQRVTFFPTPYAVAGLIERGFTADPAVAAMAERWQAFAFRDRSATSKYGNVINKNPWPHQDAAIDFAVKCPSPYLDLGMGCGKTLVAIATMAACNHRLNLILCPKAVVNVWPREFRKHSRGDFVVVPLDQNGTAKGI